MKRLILVFLLITCIGLAFAEDFGSIPAARAVDGRLISRWTNTSTVTGSLAGYISSNGTDSLMFYTETTTDGGDHWIKAYGQGLNFNVPTGESYVWYINEIAALTLQSGSLKVGTKTAVVDNTTVTSVDGDHLTISGGTLSVDDDWWNAVGDISLTSAHILVGTSGGVAADVGMSGDVNISNTGVTSLQANVVGEEELDFANIDFSNFVGDGNYVIPWFGASGIMHYATLGTAGQAFISNGASSAPTFQDLPTFNIYSATDTNLQETIASTEFFQYDGTYWVNHTFAEAKLWDITTDLVLDDGKGQYFQFSGSTAVTDNGNYYWVVTGSGATSVLSLQKRISNAWVEVFNVKG